MAVTVPGAPALWRDLHARFGKLPFSYLFEPAIMFATSGYPVSPIVAYYWARSVPIYTNLVGDEYKGWAKVFAPGGHSPRSGEKWRSLDHAATLRRLAQSNCDDFYKGVTAAAIANFASETGGVMTEADLAAHTSTWVDPISTSYKGYDVWEIPPNGQGIVALTGLNILEGFDLADSPRDSAASFHLQIKSLKLAFADGLRYVADPAFADVPVAGLLDKQYAQRAARPDWQQGVTARSRRSQFGRHRLSVRSRQRRHDGQLHPIQLCRLRVGHSRPRNGHSTAKPGRQLQPRPQPPQPS